MINCTFENGNKALLRHVVVDTLILKEGKILLVKRSNKISEGGKWGLVGGFVERDETLEEAVARETKEETGWELKDIKFLGVIDNPDRNEDRQNISMVHSATAIEKIGEGDWESDEQKWFDLNDLPEKSMLAFDHFEIISRYKEFLETGERPLTF
jgi:8-oxo-dGTP diphosphatase